MRAGAGLRERGKARRAAGSSVRVGPLSAAALRVEEGGRPAARQASYWEPQAAGSPKPESARPAFFFDLACPFSYITAERVERLLGNVEWVPTPGHVLAGAHTDPDAVLVQASSLARAARLPLVRPDRFPAPVPRVMRAAAYAAEIGAGARFALAASRLAFCGGFDLEKPSVLSDVAAAAGLPARECLAAAAEEWRDEELSCTAESLSAQGVSQLPVIGIDGRWFDGVGGVSEAAAWLRRD